MREFKNSRVGTLVFARLGVLLISFTANTVSTRLIIESRGEAAYAGIALLAALPALLPYADLGIGSAVVNAGVDLRGSGGSAAARRVVGASIRVLALSTSIITIVAISLALVGAWPAILGPAAAQLKLGGVAASCIVLLAGVGTLNGLPLRLLQGWQRNLLIVLLAGAVPVVSLLFTAGAVALDAPSGVLALSVSVASLVVSSLYWVPAVREYPGSIAHDIRSLRVGLSDYTHVLSLGISSLLVSVALTIGFQLDRIILSHLSSASELATYSLAAPLYAALMSVINPVAQTLWPRYRELVRRAALSPSVYFRDVAKIVALAAVGAVGLVGIGPWVIGVMTATPARFDALPLLLALGVLALVQAVHLPAAMVLTDRAGFRIQAVIVVLMAAINVVLSVLLAQNLGGVGVVLGSILSVGVFQMPVTAWMALRRMMRPLA